MKLTFPELALVVLVGASGSGKSTFARQHFRPTEVLSSDYCRGVVSDDENDQSATKDAFDVLHYIAAKRLAAARLTVVDATNTQPEDRKHLVQLAKRYHAFAVAIVLNLPEDLCLARNHSRPDRQFGPHVVRRHVQNIRRSLRELEREGFRHTFVLNSVADIESVQIERQPLWNNRKFDHGPFDIIGDIHGCADELEILLGQLGYQPLSDPSPDPVWSSPVYHHPQGRKVVFLGDLVDRGPRILDVVNIARNMVQAGSALCVVGNHEFKLLRKLRGKNVKVNHGLEQTLNEIESLPDPVRTVAIPQMADFLDGLISHYVLDDGKLVVAHAGLTQELQGRGSGEVRSFAMYGETTGEIDEFGLPVRFNWASEYRGSAMVVYGHTPVPEATWLNHTLNIDTGCVFGGRLTALRYPERELVSVPAAREYCPAVKPLFAPTASPDPEADLSLQQQQDTQLDLADVLGKRVIHTQLHPPMTIPAEQAATALEIMSRFAVSPQWLIYLPPTMSPVATSEQPQWLEYPPEAFAYFRQQGISQVICQEKHMGSRAVVIVCRDEATATRRFGVVNEGFGLCYTRTGRRFFDDAALELAFLDRIREALTRSGLWERLHTDWVCLDAELMPWSAKAQALLRQQYAAVGAASRVSLGQATALLHQTAQRGIPAQALAERFQARHQWVTDYVTAYRRYCWPVESLTDLKLAPFHLLASEGAVHSAQSHDWHMQQAQLLAQADPDLVQATEFRLVDLADPASEVQAIAWWEELTEQGGEGMVVKPLSFVVKGERGLVQPAVKCRGREYLRLIYGPEYTDPAQMDPLRQRSLGKKRSLALREFALGLEALERFVRRAPLRQVHECVFGILALESDPVDPRL